MTERDTIAATLADEATALERELAEIELLIGQARAEAGRHEGKRAQSADRLASLVSRGETPSADLGDLSNQVMSLTKRAALMDAQVEVLEGKRKTIVRFRDTLRRHVDELRGPTPSDPQAIESAAAPETGPSRVLLSAQEDLRREIARAMHDGPAQSLTNIVLQAQIVDRILERDPSQARGEVRLLVSMVQQTLEATKSFIFDVRPMVLDDLGLVPTLRRSARERGRRAGIPVEFETLGSDRRLSMELESGLFRILDEALAAYLSIRPERVTMRLDWADELEVRVAAFRSGTASAPPEPETPGAGSGREFSPTLAAMMDDRQADHMAAVEAARVAAIAVLPPTAWRELESRAATLGVTAELLRDGGELRLAVRIDDAVGALAADRG
jgi:two-component system sensor histidine kinase DegS